MKNNTNLLFNFLQVNGGTRYVFIQTIFFDFEVVSFSLNFYLLHYISTVSRVAQVRLYLKRLHAITQRSHHILSNRLIVKKAFGLGRAEIF